MATARISDLQMELMRRALARRGGAPGGLPSWVGGPGAMAPGPLVAKDPADPRLLAGTDAPPIRAGGMLGRGAGIWDPLGAQVQPDRAGSPEQMLTGELGAGWGSGLARRTGGVRGGASVPRARVGYAVPFF